MNRRGFTLIELLVVIAIIAMILFFLRGDATPLYLIAGWIWFLARVIPQIQVSPSGVATGVICLALFVFGFHKFMNWAIRPPSVSEAAVEQPCWRFRWTAGITALVIVMFAAGIAAVGVVHQVGWMATSSEPMYTGGRTPAFRSQSSNNLKQIVLAAHNFADAHENRLPPGYTVDTSGRPLHGWPALLLPYIEQDQIFNRLQIDKPWHDTANRIVIVEPIRTYINPHFAVEHAKNNSGNALIDYAANIHAFPQKRGLRMPADFADGTAHTILFGEISDGFCPWGHYANLRDPALGLKKSPRTFGGPWQSGTIIALADGSVRSISNNTSKSVLKALATPAAGDDPGTDW